ncbi:phage distal tail protein domain-containing protein [Leuconostoc mesenteroides]|uniref:phage distal tail protein domain-containing protein n=1 Tax=Leuconostoc mesenteroides TaxID=1245 RepID=UPI003B515461
MNSNLNNGVSMFTLQNSRGEVVDLDSDDLFGYTPTGLGAVFSNSYSQYESYFKPTKKTIQQGQMSLNILFGSVESRSYQTFSDFANFLAYEPLTLIYTTKSGSWYRDAVLSSLTKTEIGGTTVIQVDRLVEQFTIDFINSWYNNKTAVFKTYSPDPNLARYGKEYVNQGANNAISETTSIVGLAVVGKAILGQTEDESVTKADYAYGYFGKHGVKDYYYAYPESVVNSKEKSLILENNSEYFGLQEGSPSIITVEGPCNVNPSWSILKEGSVIGKDKFFLTLSSNQKLIVSSYPENQYARVYSSDGSYVDVSQLQDYTKSNFIKIPNGESTVLFYVDSSVKVNIVFKEERLLV